MSKKHLCNLCGLEMTFSPSLNERAKKTGKSVAYYKSLFTMHSDCTLELHKLSLLQIALKYPKSNYVTQCKATGCYPELNDKRLS